MTPALAERPIDAALIERVLLHGDLRQLTPAQKVSYYKSVCESVGLNPLTQPFQYLVLNGKEILYATRAATEQLRQVHAVSVQITAREIVEDCYVVTARATLASGRHDENIGAVPIAGLKGESRANAMMKAETKAKRRVTLAICGLGMLDETEVESIHSDESTEPREVMPSASNRLYVPDVPAHNGAPVEAGGSASSVQHAEPLAEVPDHQRGVTLSGRSLAAHPPTQATMPVGARRIVKVGPARAGALGEIFFEDRKDGYLTWKPQVMSDAERCHATDTPVFPDIKRSAAGNERIEALREAGSFR